ncbi:MAG: putative regulator of Ras-like GTPase activity (Roadblock/LC7/MglB family) [Rhodothermales bacterium]|jgi:predicted regulator of Ras-like GTPase activity (Roadblock/LC7/MglB family)
MALGYVLTANDFELLQGQLAEFLGESEARNALLCDSGGNVIVYSGELDGVDSIAALAAGTFSATRALAQVIGEKEFSAIFHQGENLSIFMSAVDEEVLLLALFSDETNAGLVKMYSRKACRKMQSLFREIMGREAVPVDDPTASFVLSKGPVFTD